MRGNTAFKEITVLKPIWLQIKDGSSLSFEVCAGLSNCTETLARPNSHKITKKVFADKKQL